MKQKHIGIVILVIAIALTVIITLGKAQNEANIQRYLAEKNTCFLEDGTCLHEESEWIFATGYALAGLLAAFGIYIGFIDKTEQTLTEQHVKVSRALLQAKRVEKAKDEFKAYLAGFSEDEQKVLKAIHEQEGILQATLRFRTGISKTALSLLLKDLEEREIITRNEKGKSKAIYLVKKF